MVLSRDDTGDVMLSDGVWVRDLVDEDTHSLSYRVYSDPEIYALEMERLFFARAWVVVAHESEVPNSGDFVTRSIGEDPVVVTRDSDGDVHVLLNVCAHRGMQVCRPDVGNAAMLRCPFHGWVYDHKGALSGVTAERQMYGEDFDRSRFRLRAARCTVYAGMVWATWDEAAPSLEEYLGPFKFYMDVLWNRSDRGMEVVGPPQRWYIDANWKFAADQFAVDAYHVLTLHESVIKLGSRGQAADPTAILNGTDVSSREGHALRCIPPRWPSDSPMTIEEKLRANPPAGLTPDMVDQPMRNLTPDQVRLLADSPPNVGQIFPNLAFNNSRTGRAADGTPEAGLNLKMWLPRGPMRMEVMSWILVERDAPDDVKARVRRHTTQQLASSGILDQDDAEAWPNMQRAVRGTIARRGRANYEGLLGENKPDDWPGGGLVYQGFSRDDSEWNFWLRWRDFLTDRAW